MSGIMLGAFSAGGSGGGGGDTQTVTVGYYDNFDPFNPIAGYGYSTSAPIVTPGTIVDGTFNMKGGATIVELAYLVLNGSPFIYFGLNGVQTNNGWTSMTISGNTYTRNTATFSGAGPTYWFWSAATNPFGTTTGATVVVTFA